MAKYLLAVFLIAVGCKFMAELSAFYKPNMAKQALYFEDCEEKGQKKNERGNSDPDTKYTFHSHYRINLPELQEPALRATSFVYFKPSTGYTNPAFTPPDFI